ncbi:hypothetical protein RhiirC2_794634 [Rhizophagus irregularis]|uniref:Uncharacterized protein n=1 Tax=Rhizophagus irregularis TaxID=588596 RepID=A0A2N1MD75_9GLOM|nr:hypothetical protein RhiirC2_794634 [Rhizophagus irregularis]
MIYPTHILHILETARKLELEKGELEQLLKTFPNDNQDNNKTRTQLEKTNYTQLNANVYNNNNNAESNNTFNLTFMERNINGLGPDYSKLNLLTEYCSNKGADIIGIYETNRDRKYSEYWNKQSLVYTFFWTNKDNKIKGSEVCIMINKKWEKHIGKIRRLEKVHAEAINTYSSLFCSQNHKFENLPELWKEIYEPQKDINPKIYEHLNDIPTEQEWYKMLKTMNDKSTPGISNISYKLIKKAGAKINDLIRQYTGLSRTRPILLIKCLRKYAVKIITKCLGNIFSKHAILKGPNYTGLPGKSTSAPLAIINGILKDAHKENKTSKGEAKAISLIADEFFDINDIKINEEKMKIIIVNPEERNEEENFLEIEKNNNKVLVNKESVPIRILGVWFKAD